MAPLFLDAPLDVSEQSGCQWGYIGWHEFTRYAMYELRMLMRELEHLRELLARAEWTLMAILKDTRRSLQFFHRSAGSTGRGSKRRFTESGTCDRQVEGCRSTNFEGWTKRSKPNAGHSRSARRGSKRRFTESKPCDRHVDGGWHSSNVEGRIKRSKQLNHPVQEGWPSENGFRKQMPVEKRKEEHFEESKWDDLPTDIHENILLRLEFRDLFRFKALSKSCKKYVESGDFRQLRRAHSEGSFTAINYNVKNEVWYCRGFDLHSKSWRALPPFSYLPPPDAELFREYLVSGHGGLVCADVSKLLKKGELVVFNPLTREKTALPSLLFPRKPVLVHIWVDSAQKSYKVIVAGSSTASDEHLSRKMEIFDSSTFKWKEACDLPGPAFGLNEHQAGVCLDGKLFVISFLEGDCRRGVVAFDVEQEQWLENLVCPIPFSSYSNTLQLVESDGKVYLFSEQERGQSVEHCIDVLEFPNPNAEAPSCQWRNVVRVRKSGGRGLLVYPEHTCVGFGEGKLLIFNALKRDGVVYDMRDGRQCEMLEPPPADQKGDKFFTLNPASFTFQPSFDSDPGSLQSRRSLMSVDAISPN